MEKRIGENGGELHLASSELVRPFEGVAEDGEFIVGKMVKKLLLVEVNTETHRVMSHKLETYDLSLAVKYGILTESEVAAVAEVEHKLYMGGGVYKTKRAEEKKQTELAEV